MKELSLLMALSLSAFGCTVPSAAPAAPDAGPVLRTPADTSGERLKLRTERGSDGSIRVLESRYDTKFKENCQSSCGADGKFHCLPSLANVLDSYYADKDCTQRIASVLKGRNVPAHAGLVSKESLTGDGFPCEYDRQKRIFAIEGPYRESYLYLKTEKTGGCAKVTEHEDSTILEFLKHEQLFAVSSEISASEFVAISVSVGEDPGAAPGSKDMAPVAPTGK
jgi:hypothetical protein